MAALSSAGQQPCTRAARAGEHRCMFTVGEDNLAEGDDVVRVFAVARSRHLRLPRVRGIGWRRRRRSEHSSCAVDGCGLSQAPWLSRENGFCCS